MSPNTWMLHFLKVYIINFITGVDGRLGMVVDKFGNCHPTVDYPNKFFITLHTVDGKQYVDGNATLRAAIDDDIQSDFTIELLVGKKYLPVIRLKEKRTCTNMHKFLGEFVYDVERNAQLVPGLCPIPAGRYHIHNYLLNFDKITMQDLPFGHLRLKNTWTDMNNKIVGCFVAELENQII